MKTPQFCSPVSQLFVMVCLDKGPGALSSFSRQELSLDSLGHFPYVEAVLNESLRLYPPGAVFSREVYVDAPHSDSYEHAPHSPVTCHLPYPCADGAWV